MWEGSLISMNDMFVEMRELLFYKRLAKKKEKQVGKSRRENEYTLVSEMLFPNALKTEYCVN